jgi:hypothetical protein
MKLTLILLAVMCVSLVVANEGRVERMTNDELQEMIDGYKSFTSDNENGMNAPVCFY